MLLKHWYIFLLTCKHCHCWGVAHGILVSLMGHVGCHCSASFLLKSGCGCWTYVGGHLSREQHVLFCRGWKCRFIRHQIHDYVCIIKNKQPEVKINTYANRELKLEQIFCLRVRKKRYHNLNQIYNNGQSNGVQTWGNEDVVYQNHWKEIANRFASSQPDIKCASVQ